MRLLYLNKQFCQNKTPDVKLQSLNTKNRESTRRFYLSKVSAAVRRLLQNDCVACKINQRGAKQLQSRLKTFRCLLLTSFCVEMSPTLNANAALMVFAASITHRMSPRHRATFSYSLVILHSRREYFDHTNVARRHLISESHPLFTEEDLQPMAPQLTCILVCRQTITISGISPNDIFSPRYANWGWRTLPYHSKVQTGLVVILS